MLTAKENLRQSIIKDGKPDRYSNNYEGISLLFHPAILSDKALNRGDPDIVNNWGVTKSFPENVPGAFPVHTPDKIVVKDIEHWRDYVHAPSLKFPQELWDTCKGMYDAVDGNLSYKAAFIAPGLFEQVHYLCAIDRALLYYIEYPDEMTDMIKYLTEWELELAEGICSNLHPDAIFHHDDWGGEKSSFLSPSMFEDFFLEPYKQIYGYYHDHGVELVFHHSDSYCANLLPTMIEMGIDVWQGCMHSNDVPALVDKYGGQIAFMGSIDNKQMDFPGWTADDCRRAAREAMDSCGKNYFIPCITQGGPGSVYPGSYEALWNEIDAYNCELFGFTKEELDAQRLPMTVMF